MNTKELTLLSPEVLFESINQLLQEGYDAEFTVTGNSMWPLLCHNRDRVTLRAVGEKPIRKGDIILFKAEQGYLLHRVMKLKDGFVQTAGDYNCYYDECVSSQSIIGRVVGVTRKERYISCSNLLYRFGSFLWRVLFPLRPILLRVILMIKRRRR